MLPVNDFPGFGGANNRSWCFLGRSAPGAGCNTPDLPGTVLIRPHPTAEVLPFMSDSQNQITPSPSQRGAAFVCPCCGQGRIDPRLPAIVAYLQKAAHEPLTITSACRCPAHNAAVGGSPTSSHLKGLAVDIACNSDALRCTLINRAMQLQVSRFGIGKNFIHLDIDRAKNARRIWVY